MLTTYCIGIDCAKVWLNWLPLSHVFARTVDHYITTRMGVMVGLKAFVAAVIGGIGNLPGAALGGLLLGLLETFAGGIPGVSNYRDGIAFAILILILLFKPAGLLGRLQPEKV